MHAVYDDCASRNNGLLLFIEEEVLQLQRLDGAVRFFVFARTASGCGYADFCASETAGKSE